MSLRDADRILLEDLLVEHDELDRRLAVLDRRLTEGMVEHADRRCLLETIPGVDRVSAIAILVEVSPDPVAVFGSAKHLRTVLIGCAHGAARTRSARSSVA